MLEDKQQLLGVALSIVSFLQGVMFGIDELYFHRQRGLGKWERLGHPLDSLCLCISLCLPAYFPFTSHYVTLFVILSIVSTLEVTKDEWVHLSECSPGESWLHAVMFSLHPLVFVAAGLCWEADAALWLRQFLPFLTGGIGVFQLWYWNYYRAPNHK